MKLVPIAEVRFVRPQNIGDLSGTAFRAQDIKARGWSLWYDGLFLIVTGPRILPRYYSQESVDYMVPPEGVSLYGEPATPVEPTPVAVAVTGAASEQGVPVLQPEPEQSAPPAPDARPEPPRKANSMGKGKGRGR